MDQPQSFGDFAHGHYTAVVHQVNLPFSYCNRSKGTLLPLPRWKRGTVHQGERLVHSQPGKSTSCASFPYTHTTSQPKGTTSLQSITDDNGTPATWTLILSSSKSLTGRTGHYRLRDASVYWNHWRHSLHRTLSHYNRTRTRRNDDMPCRHNLH